MNAPTERTPTDLSFHLRIARLLAELHGEETLSEQQCARYMGIDLVSWRKLERCFCAGTSFVEGEGDEFPAEDSETVLRAALNARGMDARSGETPQAARPEGQQPGAACGTRPETTAPEQRALERDAADMFWDFDDGDRMAHDITEIVADYGVGSVVKIDQAKRLPTITVRVIEGESGENDWEPIDAAQQAGKEQP